MEEEEEGACERGGLEGRRGLVSSAFDVARRLGAAQAERGREKREPCGQ
jgi:hypothetical protein